ncbi:MAG: hypothetical protein GY795_12300 [Desulfobacterales bacterium]|nr:hypothetical protein [Desulfobacterales bacterium]
MKKFTIPNFKKDLAEKSKDELIKEITSLCKIFPDVKEYYKSQTGDVKDIVKKYKDIIEKDFVDGKTRGFPKARLPVAKKAVKDFRKIVNDSELTAEIMFIYVESISDFNSEFFPDVEEFYTDPVDMFEELLQLLEHNELTDKYERRARKVVINATDGWGYRDSLEERYEEIYGDFK